MTLPGASSKKTALFLTPEDPVAGAGGGGLRSASLLAYLRQHYDVDVARFELKHHSKTTLARGWRNALRLLRGRPPLFDRYSGYESQLARLRGRYDVGVVEHFWCASYAAALRPRCTRLILDLHNIESELSRTHAAALRWPASWASARFAGAYRKLEQRWLPQFDVLLVASEADRRRVGAHPCVRVYPNALPEIPLPAAAEHAVIAFSGNLGYHPNIAAVRWFRTHIWPRLKGAVARDVEWRLVGRNPEAIAPLVSGDPRIRVIGPVDDAVAALAEARVCVVPLLSGSGTRFKILEAWASGRAVVSTTIGAEGLEARSGEHLLIADSPAAFSAAVARLLADSNLRAQLGQAGRAHYLKNFTWQAAWRALDGIL